MKIFAYVLHAQSYRRTHSTFNRYDGLDEAAEAAVVKAGLKA